MTGQSRASPMAPACEEGSCSRCREPAEDDPDSGPRTEVLPSGHIQQRATNVTSCPAITRLILQSSCPGFHAANPSNFLKGLAAQRAWQLQHTSNTGLPNAQPAASAQAATWPAGASCNAQPSVSNTLSPSVALRQGKDGGGCSKTGSETAEGAGDSPSNDAALSLLLSRLRAQRASSSLENAAARPAFSLELVCQLATHVQLPNSRACSSSLQEQVGPASSVSRWSSRASGGGTAAAVDGAASLPTESGSWGQQTSSTAESVEPGASMHQPARLLQGRPAVSVAPDQNRTGPPAGQVAAERCPSQHEQAAGQGDLSELLRRLQESKAHQQRQRGVGSTPQAAISPARHTQTTSAHTWPRRQEVSQASNMGANAEHLQTEGNRLRCWRSHSTPGADQCGPEPGTRQLRHSAGKQHSMAPASAAELESLREAAWERKRRLQQSRNEGNAASMVAASNDAFCAPQDAAPSSRARMHQQGSNLSGVAHLPAPEWHSSHTRADGDAVNVAERLRGWTSRPRPAAAQSAFKASATAAGRCGTGASAMDNGGEPAEPQGGCSKDEAGEPASASCSLRTGRADTQSGAATEANQKAVPIVEAEVHPLGGSKPWTPAR